MSTSANDNFDVYYSEKLWEWIPSIYRHEDGLADPKDVLRGIIEVIAEQAAILRRSQDRLWDDQFIDLCDDWVVPYIGELLATRLLSAQNARGRRIDVAKTIYYRRRKGTPRVLEELIADISGWKGKLVESFQRLARMRHGLDPQPSPLAGRFTRTMPGGVADLRNPVGSELASGPFDEYYHTPDFRRPRGINGRYGITKLNFHLCRLVSYQALNVLPFWIGGGQYTFDPSGRKIPLFVKDRTPKKNDWEEWHSAFEWELPVPVRCRLLGHAEFEITEESVIEITTDEPTRNELRKVIGVRFRTEAAFLNYIQSFPLIDKKEMLRLAIVDACGKNQLLPASVHVDTGSIVPKEDIRAGHFSLANNGLGKELMIDAENGMFWFTDDQPHESLVMYHYGFSGPCGAGFYSRQVEGSTRTITGTEVKQTDITDDGDVQIVEIKDSLTYTVEGDMQPVRNFALQGANQCRPYIELDKDWIFSTGAYEDGTLVLDGLWIGAKAGPAQYRVVLRGDFEKIIIRNCTFDPGGVDNAKGDPIEPVGLVLEGNVENFIIENCVMGPVSITDDSLLDESLSISDSILQSLNALPALQVTTGKTKLYRCTILGGLAVHRLYATDVIITGLATVTDNQTGCFRFSAAPSISRLPGPYESYLFDLLISNEYWFTSRQFGHPGYGQLSTVAPEALCRGAENGAEMGVFNQLINAIKLDGLKVKVDEYMPFGLIPAFMFKT